MSVFKNKHLYIIFANTLAAVMGISLVVPAMPLIAREFSIPHHQIGLFITMLTLPGVLLVLFLGVLADRLGRKALMIPSLFIFSLAGGAIYWVDSFWAICALRFVQGIGATILPTISIMLVGDKFPEGDRLKVMGLNGGVLSVGTAFFPFFGGLLAEISWRAPFLIFFAVLPVAFYAMLAFDDERPRGHAHIGDYISTSAFHMMKKGILLVYGLALAIFILLNGGVLTYLTLHMDHRFGMSAFSIGLYIGSASFASAFFAPLSHRIEEAVGRRRMFLAGFILFAACFFSVLFVERREFLIGSILLFGGAMGLTIPLLQNIVTELAPPENRGIMVSMLALVTRLGQTLGPPLLALLVADDSMLPVFAVCGVAATMFAGALYWRGHWLSRNGSAA